MGLICFVCHSHFVGTNALVRHLRLIHGLYPGKSLRLKCAQGGCCRVLSTFSGFRKHLNCKHAKNIDSEAETDHIVDSYDAADDTRSQHFEGAASSSNVLPAPNISTRDMCASAFAQLQVAGVGQSTLNNFVSSMEEVIMEVQNQTKDAALKCLSSQDTDVKAKLEKTFKTLENPFTALNTESKRNAYFEQKWKTVEPVEKVLGVRLENRRNRSTATYDQVVVTDKFAYVPILETLQSILRNPNLSDMFMLSHTPKDGVYFDINDGLHVKRHPLFFSKKERIANSAIF